MSISPAQKRLLMFGVPIVAVIGLVAYARSKSSSSKPTVNTTPAAPDNTAVGAGQLADFESAVTAQLSAWESQFAGSTLATGSTSVNVPTEGPTTAQSVSDPAAALTPTASPSTTGQWNTGLPEVNVNPSSPLPVYQPLPGATGSPIDLLQGPAGPYPVIDPVAQQQLDAGKYQGPPITVGGGSYIAVINGVPTQVPLPTTTYGAKT